MSDSAPFEPGRRVSCIILLCLVLLELTGCSHEHTAAPSASNSPAPLTLDYFLNPYCNPSRTSLASVFPLLKRDYLDTGKARLSFHFLRLTEEPSELQLLRGITCAAASQKGFLDYLNLAASNAANGIKNDPLTLARRTHIPLDSFRRCMTSGTPVALLNDSIAKANEYGSAALPALYANGNQLNPWDYDSVAKDLDRLLSLPKSPSGR
jgi:protein-disulfide isomerase